MISSKSHTTKTSRLVRYEKVFRTLIKYGFEDLLSHPPLNKIVPQTNVLVPKRAGKKVSQFTRNERIRLVCEELGTTFIKFAQIASNRPDLLHEDLIAELEKLQDNAPKVKFGAIQNTLKKSLVRPLEEMVTRFDKEPIASASMAQVHRAKLLGGQEVVLKIQRPNIKSEIASDIAILKNIAEITLKYFPDLAVYQLDELVRMFENSIEDELDFALEAKNLLHFQKMFEGNQDIHVPKYYPELSTQEIICMEYIDGYKITDLKALEAYNITGKELAQKGIGLYFEQVFKHGFFHADPHPGNIFVLPDGKIVFIDYGMMGTVTKTDQLLFGKMLLAMYEQDIEGLKNAILKFSSGLHESAVTELEIDILTFFRNYSDVNIENIDGNEMMKALNSLFFDYKIKIPSSLLLLLKALIIIEGVGLKIDPEYNIIDNIGPYTQELVKRKYNSQELKKEALRSIESFEFFLREFPEDAREIIEKIKKGKLHVEIEHKGLEVLTTNMDINVNRLSFTFIVVAILLASAIIISAGIPPKFHNVSIMGLIGVVISTLLAIRLLYAILRKGKI